MLMRQLAVLPIMWGSGKIDFEKNPDYVDYLRLFFMTAMAGMILVIQYAQTVVRKNNDDGRVMNPGQSTHITDDDKAADGSVSIRCYDRAKLNEAKMQAFMSAGISFCIHLKWGYTQPLIMMSFMQPMQLFENKAIQVLLRGKSGPGFERPWAAETGGNPLAEWAEKKKKEAEEAVAEREQKKED